MTGERMQAIKWALLGGLSFLLVAWAAYHQGRHQCPVCAEIDRAQVLSELIVPAQKLILVEASSQQRVNWTLKTGWPRMAELLRFLSFNNINRDSTGTLSYETHYAYGYDLAKRGTWSLAKTPEGGLLFKAPPVQLVGCPSVATQSFRFETVEKGVFVDEYARQNEVLVYATALALSQAHDRLRTPATHAQMKDAADKELKSLLISLAQPLGLAIKPEQIAIEPMDAQQLSAPAVWVPRIDAAGVPDAATLKMLKDAGCAS
jgi:hypothetical protein